MRKSYYIYLVCHLITIVLVFRSIDYTIRSLISNHMAHRKMKTMVVSSQSPKKLNLGISDRFIG